MARGITGSYGADTGGHPGRRVGSNDGGGVQPSGDFTAADFGGGTFPAQTPTSPPLSEQPGRGAVIDPNQAEYAPVTGSPGRYYTPDRSMTVGIGHANEATSPPLSEQPGRGVMAPTQDERISQWFQESQPTTFTPGFGGPVVAEFLNDHQFTPS